MLAAEAQRPQPQRWTFAVRTTAARGSTWKFAATLDGRVAAADGTQPVDHRRRARAPTCTTCARECDAVLVGTGTVLADDPAADRRAHADGSLRTPSSRCGW